MHTLYQHFLATEECVFLFRHNIADRGRHPMIMWQGLTLFVLKVTIAIYGMETMGTKIRMAHWMYLFLFWAFLSTLSYHIHTAQYHSMSLNSMAKRAKYHQQAMNIWRKKLGGGKQGHIPTLETILEHSGPSLQAIWLFWAVSNLTLFPATRSSPPPEEEPGTHCLHTHSGQFAVC